MQKTLIFDFDGTLVDTYQMVINAINHFAYEYKYDEILDAEWWRWRDIKNIISKDLKLKLRQLPSYIYKVKKEFHRHAESIVFFNGIIDVLDQLKDNFQLGILSSSKSETIEQTLKKYNVDCFDFVCWDSGFFWKHRKLKKLCREQKLDARNIIYIGDEVRDIKASKRFGIQNISVTWWFATPNLLKSYEPTFLVDEVVELLKVGI